MHTQHSSRMTTSSTTQLCIFVYPTLVWTDLYTCVAVVDCTCIIIAVVYIFACMCTLTCNWCIATLAITVCILVALRKLLWCPTSANSVSVGGQWQAQQARTKARCTQVGTGKFLYFARILFQIMRTKILKMEIWKIGKMGSNGTWPHPLAWP